LKVSVGGVEMSEEETAWTKALEQKRKQLVHALAVKDFETADQLKETIEEMERHARSRGWRLKEH
jgi:protein-arginine kinase activator protein McsA